MSIPIRFLLLAGLFSSFSSLKACSCFWQETFCEYASAWPDQSRHVFQMRILSYDQYVLNPDNGWSVPLMDILVVDSYFGDYEAGDTLTLFGQDGLNCAMPFSWLPSAETYIMFTYDLEQDGRYSWHPDFPVVSTYPVGELLGCGPSALAVNDDVVSGPISPGVNSMPLAQFKNELSSCTLLSSIEEPLSKNDWALWPNPASNQISIRVEDGRLEHIEIRDIQARLIWEEQTSAGRQVYNLQGLDSISPGLYLLTIFTDQGRSTKRVILR